MTWLRLKCPFGHFNRDSRGRFGHSKWNSSSGRSTVALDLGASWVHGVRGNPITSLLEKAGAILHKTDWNSFTLYYRGEEVEVDLGWGEFKRWTEHFKKNVKADMSLSAALERYLAEKNLSAEREFLLRHLVSTDIETEFGASINDMSLKSFNEDDEFKGGDALVSSGYDALIDSLAQGADVRLNMPVEAITDTGRGVLVAAGRQEYSARYALVTVPLGVLQKGAIKFSPSLSRAKTKALRGLGMGNLHKTFLEFDHQFWNDVQRFGVAHGDTAWREFISLRKETGRPILLALHAGEAATRLQGMSGAGRHSAHLRRTTASLARRIGRCQSRSAAAEKIRHALNQSFQQPTAGTAIGVFWNSLGLASSRSGSLAACSGVRPRLR